MRLSSDSRVDMAAETDASITWVSGSLRWGRIAWPVLAAALGVACVAAADALARQGAAGAESLWWLGVLAIVAPTAAALFLVRLTRTEALSMLLIVGVALYAVKLLYSPGMLWGYDELLHYRTVDNLLTSRHLFTRNALLPVSPYYPGMESVTAAIVLLTGLSIVHAGMVLIGVARLLTVVSVFLLFERIATPPRLAAPATLLYLSCPAFLYFDSMFSYESLALALSLVCLFVLRAGQLDTPRRRGLNLVGALLLLAVVVTHHVTSFILVATLAAWTVVETVHIIRTRNHPDGQAPESTDSLRSHASSLPGSGWVPVLGVVAVTIWLTNVAEIAVSYLGPPLVSGLTEVLRIIRFQGAGRRLFESTAGHSPPLLERALGIGSVLIIVALIPFGVKYLWERRRTSLLSRSLAVASLAYPATLALRFTQSGWDVGSRATAYVYLPLAFAVAAGIEFLTARHSQFERFRAIAVVSAALVIFTGGIIAGTSPVTRQPAPYDPGIAEVPFDAESVAAVNWAASTLGPEHRFAADSAGGTLIGSIGRQQLVTSEDGVSVSALFLSPGFGAAERAIVKGGGIEYVLVDRRVAGSEPLKGFIFEKWERELQDYGSSVSSVTVNKFEVLREANKEFDSGNIQLFNIHRLVP